jgi:hypothetical protein
MGRTLCLSVMLVSVGLSVSLARAESWECGGAKIHCGGSPETCDVLKRACTPELQSSSEVDRELAQAVRDAQNGSTAPQSGDPFERLTRAFTFQGCTEQRAKEGKCGVFYNTKELVSSVVDTLTFSADAFNQASSILRGQP